MPLEWCWRASPWRRGWTMVGCWLGRTIGTMCTGEVLTYKLVRRKTIWSGSHAMGLHRVGCSSNGVDEPLLGNVVGWYSGDDGERPSGRCARERWWRTSSSDTKRLSIPGGGGLLPLVQTMPRAEKQRRNMTIARSISTRGPNLTIILQVGVLPRALNFLLRGRNDSLNLNLWQTT